MTKAMIRAAWHMTTVAFSTVGSALVLSGASTAIPPGGSAWSPPVSHRLRGTGGRGCLRSAPRAGVLHPAPALLTAVAVLAWWGAL